MKTVLRYRYSRVDERGTVIVQRIHGVNRAGWFIAAMPVPGSDGIPPRCSSAEARDTAPAAARYQLAAAEDEIRAAQARLDEARRVHEALSLVVGGKRAPLVVDFDRGAPRHGQ